MPSTDLPITSLTPVQEQVVAAIASGATFTEAAAQASIHRNTFGNWRRSSPAFRDALAFAQYDRAMQVREQAVLLAGDALDTIKAILNDPKAPASVRLKAALAILQQASTAPPEPPVVRVNVHKSAQEDPEPNPVLAATYEPFKNHPWFLPVNARGTHKTAQTAASSQTSATSQAG